MVELYMPVLVLALTTFCDNGARGIGGAICPEEIHLNLLSFQAIQPRVGGAIYFGLL